MNSFKFKIMRFVATLALIVFIIVGCQKNELNNEKLNLKGKLATVPVNAFAKNLLFDENGYSQIITDLDDPHVSATVRNFFESTAEVALSYQPVGYLKIYNNVTATEAAKLSAENVKTLGLKVMLTADSVLRQPHIDKAAAILKAWAKVNVPDWHRPAETAFLPMYEGYSLLRPLLTPADRDTVDQWIRRRATSGPYNFSLQDGNSVNKINNWEAQRICFLLYSAYILNDSALLTKAKTAYNTFLDSYLLAGGKTADFHDRDAFVYHAYGLLYVGNILRAVRAMEGSAEADSFKNKINKSGLTIEDAVRFWEPYLCGLYHDEFKNSIFADERAGTRRGRYNPKGDLYVLNVLAQHYSHRIYPYFKVLQNSTADRFSNLNRYIALLDSPHIDYGTVWPTIQFFSDCRYAGSEGTLGIGGYSISQMEQVGLADNALSSLKVPVGLRVILFDGDFADATTLGGSRSEFTADKDCLVNIFNDKASSVIVVNK